MILLKIIHIDDFKDDVLNLTYSVRANDEPLLITSQKGNAVMLREEDWRTVEDTYLYSKYLEWWNYF